MHCCLFEQRLNSGLCDPTVLRIVNNLRMEDQQWLQESVVKQCLQRADDGCTSPDCWCREVNCIYLNNLAGGGGVDVADGRICLGVEHR